MSTTDKPSTTLAEYAPAEAVLSDLRTRFEPLTSVETPEKYRAVVKAIAETRKWRTDLEADRVKLKQPALERCRVIDAEAKRITNELFAIENPLKKLKEDFDKAKERAEREAAEAERKELERLRKAEADRIKAEEEAAAAAAREKVLAEQRAEDERLAEIARKLAEQKAEQDRIAAEQQAKFDEERKAFEAEKQRLADMQAKIDEENRLAEYNRLAEEARQRGAEESVTLTKEDAEKIRSASDGKIIPVVDAITNEQIAFGQGNPIRWHLAKDRELLLEFANKAKRISTQPLRTDWANNLVFDMKSQLKAYADTITMACEHNARQSAETSEEIVGL
jgi:DNA repair exonuclease SbcCD ATPase subunit